MIINRRWLAREWLYLLAGVVWAYVLSFLALWKDADPDIPIPKQVKAEYSKLKIPILGLACARFARGRP